MSNITTYNELKLMAKDIADGGLFGLRKTEQIVTLMLVAQSEGVHPVKALSMYDIIDGKPALKSSEMLARFQDNGGRVQWIKSTGEECEAKFEANGSSIVVRWDKKRAERAGLLGRANWQKYPEQMLRARCISEGVRAVFPRCLNNMYAPEELADVAPSNGGAIEVEVVENNTVNFKKALVKILKEHGFTSAMITEFANKHGLSQDEDKLKEIVNNNELLENLIKEFIA